MNHIWNYCLVVTLLKLNDCSCHSSQWLAEKCWLKVASGSIHHMWWQEPSYTAHPAPVTSFPREWRGTRPELMCLDISLLTPPSALPLMKRLTDRSQFSVEHQMTRSRMSPVPSLGPGGERGSGFELWRKLCVLYTNTREKCILVPKQWYSNGCNHHIHRPHFSLCCS